MNNPLLVILFITISIPINITTCCGQTSPEYLGVNLSGAEFGQNLPGTFNKDYTYPTTTELDYFKSKDLLLIRLPFKWERVQNSPGGPLNQDELNRMKNFIQQAHSRGMYVIPDMHNYCRYTLDGVSYIIGSSEVTIGHIKDAWAKLADELKDEPNIRGYGIMNEPHDMLTETHWFNIAQAIIDGIRTVDTATTIYVGGDSWSSAERWLQYSDNLKNLVDPSNNLVYEAHIYFDDDASGRYEQSYDIERATPQTGMERAQPFVDWLRKNQMKGFIGEYGVPHNDPRWLVTLENFLQYLQDNCINGTYWAAGPWWGNYLLSVEPNNDGEKPQMRILEKYTSFSPANCEKVVSNLPLKNCESDISIQPNPCSGILSVKGICSGDLVSIYNLHGKIIMNKILKTDYQLNITHLPDNVYLLKINNVNTYKFIKSNEGL